MIPKFKLYVMKFDHAHFGEGMLNDSVDNFDASRLYSALYQEAIKLGKADDFWSLTSGKDFYLSDAFPYYKEPYLPKPIGFPMVERQAHSIDELRLVRREAKTVKKIKYIPFSLFNDYLNNKVEINEVADAQSGLSETYVRMRKGVDPYEVGVTAFNSSLYVIATPSLLFDELMGSLQYSGLGGKRTTGLGQFDLFIKEVPSTMERYLMNSDSEKFMLLTSSLPKDDELNWASKGAKYLLKKSSGYAFSTEAKELLRKQDVYKFKAGSTFNNSFEGSIIDVRPDGFPHSVWHYSKGLFYAIDI